MARPLLIHILVPVIAVFTKMDALDDEARNQLMYEEVSFAKIKEQVPVRARAIFEKNYLQRLEKVKHKPSYVVELRGMLPFVTSLKIPATH
jgi:GTPase